MDEVYSFVVDKPGARLDKYLGEMCPALSRTRAQKLISDGYITVNHRVAKASFKLDINDKINVIIPPTLTSRLLPEDIPLDIVYEDDELIVIDKPAGLTT
ncbi:S4 domain-containing protein, partial [Chloroflexota bacterium]